MSDRERGTPASSESVADVKVARPGAEGAESGKS
jgi:hypothetical protein